MRAEHSVGSALIRSTHVSLLPPKWLFKPAYKKVMYIKPSVRFCGTEGGYNQEVTGIGLHVPEALQNLLRHSWKRCQARCQAGHVLLKLLPNVWVFVEAEQGPLLSSRQAWAFYAWTCRYLSARNSIAHRRKRQRWLVHTGVWIRFDPRLPTPTYHVFGGTHLLILNGPVAGFLTLPRLCNTE